MTRILPLPGLILAALALGAAPLSAQAPAPARTTRLPLPPVPPAHVPPPPSLMAPADNAMESTGSAIAMPAPTVPAVATPLPAPAPPASAAAIPAAAVGQPPAPLAAPLAAPSAAPSAAPPGGASAAPMTPAQRNAIDIARVQTYLDGLATLKARFLQVAPNGSTAEGTAWLDRPGRMRFEYDPPNKLLLVAGHGLLVFHDGELNQTTNIPLDRTPLGILLTRDVRLSGPVTVTAIERQPGLLAIRLVRTASPGDGSLTLYFNDAPLSLRQWSVVDAQGRETRVTLYDVQFGGSFDQRLFEYTDSTTPQTNGG